MPIRRISLIAGSVFFAAVAAAQAQSDGSPYPLYNMNFDMWCQEEQHLPPARCDQRLPQDDADYEAYVATIERYEIPYLQRKEDQANLNRVIIHNDPIDHPIEPSAPQVNQISPPSVTVPQ